MEGNLKGYLKEDLEGDFEVDLEGDFRGDLKKDLEGDLLSSIGQLRSRSGLVQVLFSLELKFNSLELDSEVGRLVYLPQTTFANILQHAGIRNQQQHHVLLSPRQQQEPRVLLPPGPRSHATDPE